MVSMVLGLGDEEDLDEVEMCTAIQAMGLAAPQANKRRSEGDLSKLRITKRRSTPNLASMALTSSPVTEYATKHMAGKFVLAAGTTLLQSVVAVLISTACCRWDIDVGHSFS